MIMILDLLSTVMGDFQSSSYPSFALRHSWIQKLLENNTHLDSSTIKYMPLSVCFL